MPRIPLRSLEPARYTVHDPRRGPVELLSWRWGCLLLVGDDEDAIDVDGIIDTASRLTIVPEKVWTNPRFVGSCVEPLPLPPELTGKSLHIRGVACPFDFGRVRMSALGADMRTEL